MTPAMIFELLVKFGPGAIEIIRKLAAIWNKPELTEAEVLAFCDVAQKSYDDYINAGKAPAPLPLALTPGT